MSEGDDGRRRPGLRGVSLHLQVVGLLAIAVSPIGAVGIWQAVNAAKETAHLSEDALISRTRLAAEEERAALTAAFGVADGLSAAISLVGPNPEPCSNLFQGFVESDPRFVFSGLIGPNGVVACSSSPDGVMPEHVSSLIQDLKDDVPRKRVRFYKNGESLDSVTLTVLRPIYKDGGLTATLALSLPDSLFSTMTVSTDESADFRLALLDDRGRIFAEDTDHLGDANWTPQEVDLRHDAQPSERVVTHQSHAGEARSYAIVPILAGDIYALGSWRDRDLANAASNRIWKAVLFPAAMWALALGVSYFAVYLLAVRHITYLRRILRAFQGGRRNLRAMKLEGASAELSELGRAFDQMAENIELDEQELRRGLDEKNTLLREVYHRVKNNLQLVVSMTNLQMRRSQSTEVRDAIKQLQERVMGLAAVHQRLYQASDLTAVRCDELLTDVTTNIGDAVGAPAAIYAEFDMIPLLLSPDQAIPLSLFATECVMNAVKHSGCSSTKLLVSLTESDDGQIRFSVNNTVEAGETDASLNTGIGSQLMEAFSRQLNGKFEIDRSENRYGVVLTFPLCALVKL